MRVMITSFSIRREFVGNGSMWAAQSAVSEPRLKFLACKALLATRVVLPPRSSNRRESTLAEAHLLCLVTFFEIASTPTAAQMVRTPS